MHTLLRDSVLICESNAILKKSFMTQMQHMIDETLGQPAHAWFG